MRAVVGFGHFWWEFLIGDTPELFVGVVVVLVAVGLLCLHHPDRRVAAFVEPALVAVVVAGSVWSAVRRARRP